MRLDRLLAAAPSVRVANGAIDATPIHASPIRLDRLEFRQYRGILLAMK